MAAWDEPGADPLGDLKRWVEVGKRHLPGRDLYEQDDLLTDDPFRPGARVVVHELDGGYLVMLAEESDGEDCGA